MDNAAQKRRPSRRHHSTGGGGGSFWFILLLLVGGAGATYYFVPEKVRAFFGKPETPKDGPVPTAPQHAKTDLNERETGNDINVGEPSQVNRTLPNAPKAKAAPTAPAPAAPKKTTDFPGEAEAQSNLLAAEQAYKKFDWAKARGAAQKIIPLDAKPATKVRAKDILRGADMLEKLFTELNSRDELSRNYDTNPSLVMIKTGGESSYAVPIRSMDDQTVVESGALEFLNSQRSAGKIAVLLKGRKDFMAASLTSDSIGAIEPADLTKILRQKQDEFASRLGRLKSGDMAKDAMAWYDAGKFAYRNRLDDRVTEMMDHAIVLDPMLVNTVREDKAGTLFANVVLHIKNGNTKQAAAFMAIINKNFPETESGKQAKLFYEGKTQEMLAARKESVRVQREEEQKRREARLERANELGDHEAAAAIAKEPEKPKDDDVSAIAGPVSGDEAAADAFFDKGKDIYQNAIDSGNSDNRDSLYAQACDEFTKAMAIYNNLLEKSPGNTALEEKAFLCNKLRYGSIKQRRFH